MEITDDQLVYGCDPTECIVSCEVKDDMVYLYKEIDGKLELEKYDMEYWILSSRAHINMTKLDGDLCYDHMWTTDKYSIYKDKVAQTYAKPEQYWHSYNIREMAMLRDGFTYFKGLEPSDVSIMGFDIEANGLSRNDDAEVFCISTTYRCGKEITKQCFNLDEFTDSYEMIECFCDYVRDIDPTILVGHNIYNYDLPYLQHVYALQGGKGLQLGRDDSRMKIPPKKAKKRVDGSRDMDFNKIRIFGREIVDTMYLAMDYDKIEKKYPSYGLKPIIEAEGLIKKGRIFYDASMVGKNWHIPEEREKIKAYCVDDSDDAIALYDLMIPAYFSLTRYLPKTFEEVLVSAAGSQLNNLMIRSYLMKDHSIPRACEVPDFQGAYSFGKPGIYKNVFKIDVASLYPSIMRQHEIYDERKDPLKHMLLFVNIFTDERLKNKKIAKETGDRYYDALQNAQKIIINSFYGFLATSGLNFNSPANAALVTKYGREILNHSAEYYCGGNFFKGSDDKIHFNETDGKSEFSIVNADTDSIAFIKRDLTKFTEGERFDLVNEINGVCREEMGPLIIWEDDKYYDMFVVLKTKNYAMKLNKSCLKKKSDNPYIFKGSSIKDTKVEKVFQDFKREVLMLFLEKKQDQFFHLYIRYLRRIMNIGSDEEPIGPWCNKKTITDSILEGENKIAKDTLEACKDIVINLEDRIYVYKTMEGKLCLKDNYVNDHDPFHYIKRLYASTEIFKSLVDIKIIPNYSLKANKDLLEEIL